MELEGVALDEQGAPFSVEELEWLLKSKEAEGEGEVVATGSMGSFVPSSIGVFSSQDSLYTLIFRAIENQAAADSVTIKIK